MMCDRKYKGRASRVMVFLLLLLAALPVFARGPSPKPLPSLVRKTDIMIWDEQYLGRSGQPPRGWTVPTDYGYVSGGHWSWPQEISGGTRHGRFGVLSGGRLYTTWRAGAPLTDAEYVEGNTTFYEHHVSNLLTPPFEIKKPYVTFLLSGGNAPGEACVNLLLDPVASTNGFNAACAKVVRSATGRNDDMLEWVAFTVTNYVGRMARIQVLDTSTAGFGYVTVDCVCQSPDTKGAVRVIAAPPAAVKTVSHVETAAGKRMGPAVIKKGRLLVGGQPVNLQGLLSWNTGATSGGATGRRVELVNGDAVVGNVSGLKDGKLILDSAMLGETNLPLSIVAQVLFAPGPSVAAKPGTLIHANGNKIPGELSWIRKDNISIKCTLGQLPLPRGRVLAFVFGEKKPVAAAATVVLVDGSSLSGTLTLAGDGLVLKHAALGALEFAIADVARVTRRVAGVTPLAGLRSAVRERVGAVRPPLPLRVDDERGTVLRMFPRTAVRYGLSKSAAPRRLRGVLAPVTNSRATMTAHVRTGATNRTYTVQPGGDGVAVDVDLGTATSFELIADASSPLSYPCGIEWRNAIIVGGAKQ
ncbi:MAG: hypothetical protein HN919_03050 [Verrucomicrobia bacterium]|jgi:hypothetical protein|nr:hypothetical protein [Verrucomicrobiota bacterium]MBT7065254.1 hypothetical protein [Verrucomicrobiota bacterium]MBT7701712.1 hypothetical protein [Verrucomicrobiota bacterium]